MNFLTDRNSNRSVRTCARCAEVGLSREEMGTVQLQQARQHSSLFFSRRFKLQTRREMSNLIPCRSHVSLGRTLFGRDLLRNTKMSLQVFGKRKARFFLCDLFAPLFQTMQPRLTRLFTELFRMHACMHAAFKMLFSKAGFLGLATGLPRPHKRQVESSTEGWTQIFIFATLFSSMLIACSYWPRWQVGVNSCEGITTQL